MKRSLEAILGLVLLASMVGIGWTLGWRQALLGLVFSTIWFIISLVLLTRPPGIPEIVRHETSSDMPAVIRTDPIPILPTRARVRISLCIACGICLLTWVTLGR